MSDKSNPGHRQRLKERFMAGEDDALTDEALLELLLSYSIPQKDVQPLAKNLVAEFGCLDGVLAAKVGTLCQFSGIHFHSATLLKLVNSILSQHSAPVQADAAGRTQTRKAQTTLFDVTDAEERHGEGPPTAETRKLRPGEFAIRRRGTGLFAKAVLKETIELLPRLPSTESLAEVRQFVRKNLHFNSEITRIRFGDYMVQRMFPHGYADQAIRQFATGFEGRQELRDICFYRFCKAEPLMQSVLEDLVLPGIGNGRLERSQLAAYLSHRFPSAREIPSCSRAIVDALVAGGAARADRLRVSFAYRDILAPSFAFVLHSEFPEPGMYDIAKIEQNASIRAMLWHPDRIVHTLYELRNLGLVAKVSEIDRIRQFTIKWTLEQAVEHIVAG